MNQRKIDFINNQAQTNPSPYLIDVERAEGIYIWDKSGRSYMDMIAGVAVNNIGHCHPKVTAAIHQQVDQYLHVMVYGEFIQDAQLNLAKNLQSILPPQLNCSYTVNSGTEANEGALKLAKRYTGRSEIIAFKGSYHGGTHGSLSVSGNEMKKAPFRPLLPQVKFLDFNKTEGLENITTKTAAVIIEPVQGDAGIRIPTQDFLVALRNRCTETGTLLIFDEVQTGFGRTGSFFAFQKFNVIPDILTLGKALGGDLLIQDPEIFEIRRAGLMFAIDMRDFERVKKVVDECLDKGLISFWFLSHPNSFRLSPPLSITEEEIKKAGKIILAAIASTRS